MPDRVTLRRLRPMPLAASTHSPAVSTLDNLNKPLTNATILPAHIEPNRRAPVPFISLSRLVMPKKMTKEVHEDRVLCDSLAGDVRYVNASVLAAILVEVLPVEADFLLLAFIKPGSIAIYALIKVFFLTVILAPLAWFFFKHGLSAFRFARKRILLVAAIVGVNLIANLIVIARIYHVIP
jgi:hypothetical protein